MWLIKGKQKINRCNNLSEDLQSVKRSLENLQEDVLQEERSRGLYISAVDFMKDVCDNINTFIDGYLENNEEFFAGWWKL